MPPTVGPIAPPTPRSIPSTPRWVPIDGPSNTWAAWMLSTADIAPIPTPATTAYRPGLHQRRRRRIEQQGAPPPIST